MHRERSKGKSRQTVTAYGWAWEMLGRANVCQEQLYPDWDVKAGGTLGLSLSKKLKRGPSEMGEGAPIYQDKAWLKKQYEKAGSIYKMADIAGCHYRTIHKWMKKFGIPMHGMKGQKRSVEDIAKFVAARKGKPSPMAGRHHSEKTKRKMSAARRGAGNANWKGGITERIRKFRRNKDYVNWVKAVIYRAKGRCEECESTENVELTTLSVFIKTFQRPLTWLTERRYAVNATRKKIGGSKLV